MRTVKTNVYVALFYRFLVLLLLYTVLRLAFYWVNSSLFPSIETGELMVMLLGGVKFDLVALLYINSLYILLQIAPVRWKYTRAYETGCKWLFLVSNAIGIALNMVDFVYYRYTLKRTTASVFDQFVNESNLFKLSGDFLRQYWYLLFSLIAVVWLLKWFYERVQIEAPARFSLKVIGIQSVSMFLIAGLVVIGIRGGWKHSTRPVTLSNAGEFVERPEEMYVVLNTPFSIIRTLGSVPLKEVHYFSEEELASLYHPFSHPRKDSVFKPLNVVVLIIESLGKEHVGALNRHIGQGKYKGYTPFLDSLIAESFTFNASYANGRKSIDALPSILSGIPSIQEPFVLSDYSGNDTESMAHLLEQKGYETAFFHGAPNGSMGFSSYTQLAGFNAYYGMDEYNNDADFDGTWGIWDEPFLQYMADELNHFQEPFLSAFFSLSSHHPFKVPAKYEGHFPEGPLPVQQPIGYTDLALRRFFEKASKMSWYKNTLFVICADHATVSHLPEYQTALGAYAIPIVFYQPGGNLKGVSDRLVQQIDILPTVLGYLNYDKSFFSFGFDAFSSEEGNFVINNNGSSFMLNKGDYLLLGDGAKSTSLFNTRTDPLLKIDLLGSLPAVQLDMENSLKAFIQQYNNRMIANRLKAGKP
jgi:hypothetical protein